MNVETLNRKIEEAQNQIRKNRITNLEELKNFINNDWIDLYEEVLFPIGYNTCDRCEALGDSGYDFIWIDYLEEEDSRDKAVLDGMNKEKADYCAICFDCVKKLAEL